MDFAAEQEGHGFLPFFQGILFLFRKAEKGSEGLPFQARIGPQPFCMNSLFFCEKHNQAVLQSIPPKIKIGRSPAASPR